MAKRFMRKSNMRLCTFILSGFVLFNTACAQNPPFTGKAYVDEEKLVERSTVLLNNASYLIPLQNLDQLKIASVHFSNQYAVGFDSLLNKYNKVTAYNGSIYSALPGAQAGIKNLDDLSAELKWY